MATSNSAKFSIGEVVKHRHFDFRGVIYDVDFEFNNSEEWYQSIPKEVRPRKDQPFYHLLAESNDVTYEAYVSEQNLLLDNTGVAGIAGTSFGQYGEGFLRFSCANSEEAITNAMKKFKDFIG